MPDPDRALTEPEQVIADALNELYRSCDADQLEMIGRQAIIRGVAIWMRVAEYPEIAEFLYRIADDLATRRKA